MNKKFVIYSDRKVRVTSREFSVDNTTFQLKGIAEVRMHFVRHYKRPPFAMLLLVLAGIASGVTGVFDNIQIEERYTGNILITSNRLPVLIGSIVLLLDLLWLSILHKESYFQHPQKIH